MCFSGISLKILTFEYYVRTQIYSEVSFICFYQVWSKLIEKCPSKFKMEDETFRMCEVEDLCEIYSINYDHHLCHVLTNTFTVNFVVTLGTFSIIWSRFVNTFVNVARVRVSSTFVDVLNRKQFEEKNKFAHGYNKPKSTVFLFVYLLVLLLFPI